jgi:hypothetical protein
MKPADNMFDKHRSEGDGAAAALPIKLAAAVLWPNLTRVQPKTNSGDTYFDTHRPSLRLELWMMLLPFRNS